MVSLYYSFIHSYLNYGIMTWCSMSIKNLKKLASKQRQALRTITIPTIESELRSKQIMKEICILHIYQLNTYNLISYNIISCLNINTYNLMFKVKNGCCFSE